MKALVFGADGCTGQELVKQLTKKQYETVTTCHDSILFSNCRLESYYLKLEPKETNTVADIIKKINPDLIFNATGSFTGNFDTDYKNNVLASKCILDAMVSVASEAKALFISSVAELDYNATMQTGIFNDGLSAGPSSLYGLTKQMQTDLVSYYYSKHNLKTYTVRTSNLFGPNVSKQLFVGRVYDLIEQYKLGQINKLEFGSLEAERDYITVEDAVSAYITILEKCEPGVTRNVGSGETVKMRDLLKYMLTQRKLDFNIIKETPGPCGIPRAIVKCTLLNQLGWQPRTSIKAEVEKCLS